MLNILLIQSDLDLRYSLKGMNERLLYIPTGNKVEEVVKKAFRFTWRGAKNPSNWIAVGWSDKNRNRQTNCHS